MSDQAKEALARINEALKKLPQSPEVLADLAGKLEFSADLFERLGGGKGQKGG